MGSWPGVAAGVAGVTGAVGSCCWRKLTILAEGPSTAVTFAVSVARLAPGALIRVATRCTSPSSPESWVSTSRSTPPMPSEAAAPNVTAWLVLPVS